MPKDGGERSGDRRLGGSGEARKMLQAAVSEQAILQMSEIGSVSQ